MQALFPRLSRGRSKYMILAQIAIELVNNVTQLANIKDFNVFIYLLFGFTEAPLFYIATKTLLLFKKKNSRIIPLKYL